MESLELTRPVESKVRERLNEDLNTGFSNDVPNHFERERESLKLFRDILTTPGLEDELVARITSYVIQNCKHSLTSFGNTPNPNRLTVFMNTVDNFLTSHQCLLLAEHFNKQIKEEKEEKLTR